MSIALSYLPWKGLENLQGVTHKGWDCEYDTKTLIDPKFKLFVPHWMSSLYDLIHVLAKKKRSLHIVTVNPLFAFCRSIIQQSLIKRRCLFYSFSFWKYMPTKKEYKRRGEKIIKHCWEKDQSFKSANPVETRSNYTRYIEDTD